MCHLRCKPSLGRVAGRAVAPPRRRLDRAGEAGSVLLETALAIPLLMAVAVALAWAVALGGRSMVLGDAARQVARDVARGVATGDAVAAASAVAPEARLSIESDGESVVVVATSDVAAPVPILKGISVTLRHEVVVPREWS